MSQHLPVDFKWIDDIEIFNVMLVPDDDFKGYTLEVSLGIFCFDFKHFYSH